jgi:drug/metabolite transporter (DMT)-like permease
VQELCILTVVVAGLAVLSYFHLGPRARRTQPTAFTFSLVLVAMISLVAGAILYAMASTYQIQETDFVTNLILIAAAISSYFLRIEEAILDA